MSEAQIQAIKDVIKMTPRLTKADNRGQAYK